MTALGMRLVEKTAGIKLSLLKGIYVGWDKSFKKLYLREL